jgi:hypothetical protein
MYVLSEFIELTGIAPGSRLSDARSRAPLANGVFHHVPRKDFRYSMPPTQPEKFTMEPMRQEDFEALPYVERRDLVRAAIEGALAYIETRGRVPEESRSDEMRWAINAYQERAFFDATYHATRVLLVDNVQCSNAFGEPDRSLSLRAAWARAQANVAALEASEAPAGTDMRRS